MVIGGVPSHGTLGHMLSFASGIMMYISYCDLLIHAQLELDSMFWANVWVRGCSTAPWGVPFLPHSTCVRRVLTTTHRARRACGNLQMFVGMASFLVITNFVPEPELGEVAAAADKDGTSKAERKRLMLTGMIAAIGISLHNFPEGLVVYNSVLTGTGHVRGMCPGSCTSLHRNDTFTVLAGVCDDPMGENDMQSLSTIFDYMTRCMGRGLAVSAAIAMHNIPGASHCTIGP